MEEVLVHLLMVQTFYLVEYYKITSNGMIVLDNYRNEWRNFSNNVNGILMGN